MPAKKKKSMKMRPTKQTRKIPEPPGTEVPCEEIDAYFAEHSLENLEKAGHARPLNAEEMDWVDKLSAVAGEKVRARKGRSAQLNLAMSEEQLNRFNTYAKKKHIPPSTLARAWILERLDSESKDAS